MKKELLRQLLHLFFGSILIILLPLMGLFYFSLLIALVLAIGLLLAVAIMRGIQVPIVRHFLSKAGRKSEKIPGKGALSFFLGMLITIVLFQNFWVVLGALIVLVMGDSLATMAGKTIGQIPIWNNKTAEGSIFAMFISFLYLWIIFQPIIALFTAVIGMSMEFIPLDDNLTIPIVSGLVLFILL